VNYTIFKICYITILLKKYSIFDVTINTETMKNNKIKPAKKDNMLYRKTNEDFNNEKPNPVDPTQIKVNPIEEEIIIKTQKK
jgi:hypothetical protein